MGLTHFPYGVSSFGTPIVGATTGNVFFVSSTKSGRRDAADHGRDPETPFATLAYAIAHTTASQGDIIYVMPGHTESLSGAAAIACNKAGVAIIGMGFGNNRPIFTWASTDATWTVPAANVTIQNVITKVSVDEVVSMFSVSAADVTFDTVDFQETTSAQAIQWLLTTSAANRLVIKSCHHRQMTAAGSAQKWIQLVAGTGARILDNTFLFTANAATGSQLIAGTTAVAAIEIARNRGLWLGGTITTIVNLVTTSTGIIADNRFGSGTAVATSAAFTGDACYMFNNLWSDTAAASGLLAPVVDTDT